MTGDKPQGRPIHEGGPAEIPAKESSAMVPAERDTGEPSGRRSL